MTLLLIQLGLYWCLVKSMDWKLRFYIAAPLFVAIVTGFDWVLNSAFTGHKQPVSIRLAVVQLAMFLAIFYALERFRDADDASLAWAATFGLGLVVVVLAH